MGGVGRVGRRAGGRVVSGRQGEALAGFLTALGSIGPSQPDSFCACESQLIGILPIVSDRHTQQPAVPASLPRRPPLTFALEIIN